MKEMNINFMYKRLFYIGLSLMMMGCAPKSRYGKESILRVDHESAVYTAVLNDMYIDSTRHTLKKIDLIFIFDEASVDIERFQKYRNEMRLVSESTLDDFRAKNEQPHRFAADLNLKVEHKLITRQEIHKLVPIKDGLMDWSPFYNKYPDAAGVIYFSKIGFNQDRTEALVQIGRGCGRGCGEGGFMFLTKVDGIWKIKDSYGGWIS